MALDDAQVAHAFAHQRVARRLPAHAAAHHQHVEDGLPVGPRQWWHPVGRRPVQLVQLLFCLDFERFQSVDHLNSAPFEA
ncbi:MAG: hypothetical protein NT176_15910 [Proteobacteria bacterium]|nr:hypothetical protein [Pseudomonadota bacterium]